MEFKEFELKEGKLHALDGDVIVDLVSLVKKAVKYTKTDKDDVVFAVVEPLLKQVNFKPHNSEALKDAVDSKAFVEEDGAVAVD